MTTIQEVWIASPHYSGSRGPYNKAVLHTTEGAMKIRDLGAWFANPSAQCSSHHGADNYERGVFGAYVYENYTAWTQGNANQYCLSLEQCAYASWSRDTWLNSKGTLLHNSADWLAYVCGKYGIPLVALTNSQAQDPNIRGICQHVQFGSWGSGHSDCGSGYPMDVVLQWAKESSATAPIPPAAVTPPAAEDDAMPVAIPPGPDAPHVGVSFTGSPYKTVGFCGDDTVFDEVITIRCAFHKAGTAATWSVQTAYVDRSHNKVVINIPAGTDGVSFQRQDTAACVMYPNFGT